MQKYLSHIFLFGVLISLTSAHAGIFGADSRREARLDAPEFWQEKARAVPALIPKRQMEKVEGGWRLLGTPLQRFGMCAEIRFGEQRMIANCSASLVASDTVLTAAHCLDLRPTSGYTCQDYAIVFDYALGTSDDPHFIPAANVYHCEALDYHVFDLKFTEDLALIRLDRPVVDRDPVNVQQVLPQVGQELVMIGYPLGIFQKFVDQGQVLSVEEDKLSFKHNLDTFSVNSGGPVFDAHTGDQIGVLVRGTSPNMTRPPAGACSDWGQARENDYSEANFLTKLPL